MLSDLLLKTPIDGYNLQNCQKLGDLTQETPALFVFLSCLGGIFDSALIAELKAIKEQYLFFPDVVFIYKGTPDLGRMYFERNWSLVKAIADPRRYLFQKFEVKTATYAAYLTPQLAKAYYKWGLKYFQWRLPRFGARPLTTLFLVRKDEILWQYNYAHIGDIPPKTRIINGVMPFLL
jgi:lysophospholipase L1-like esterase